MIRAALLLVVCGWTYAGSLRGGWLWDDAQYVTSNAALRSAAGLRDIWLAPPGVNYFPLTDTVRWAQWHLCGDHPFGYRATNLALHALAALLVWRLAAKLWRPSAGAWLAGLIFAAHPLAVESAAWIAELKNVLSVPLALLALCAYLDFNRSGRRQDYLLSLAWFTLAMLAKSTVALCPAMLLAYAFWRRGRVVWADVRAACGWAVVAVALGLLTIHFEHTRAMRAEGAFVDPWRDRWLAAGRAVWAYLGKCAWPAGCSPLYPKWKAGSLPAAGLIAWAMLIGAWLGLAVGRHGWARHLALAFGCFFLSLGPTLGFIPMAYLRYSWVADHFAYLALAIWAIAAGLGLEALRERAGVPLRQLLLGAAVAAVLLVAGVSRAYASAFTSPDAEWTWAVRHNPSNWRAWGQLAGARFDQGRSEEAVADYQRTLELEPDYPEGHNNLGVAYSKLGRVPEAVSEYERALLLRPNYVSARSNLGSALLTERRPGEAAEQYEAALRINPRLRTVHYNLGIALGMLGREGEAEEQFRLAGAGR